MRCNLDFVFWTQGMAVDISADSKLGKYSMHLIMPN